MSDHAYARIHELLREFDIATEDIHPDAKLRADLDIDSAELVEIVASLTAGANSRVDGKHLKSVRTVAELAEYIDQAILSNVR